MSGHDSTGSQAGWRGTERIGDEATLDEGGTARAHRPGQHVRLLLRCSAADLGALVDVSVRFAVPAGWPLMHETTPADACYAITGGRASVFHGREEIAMLQTGDIVGDGCSPGPCDGPPSRHRRHCGDSGSTTTSWKLCLSSVRSCSVPCAGHMRRGPAPLRGATCGSRLDRLRGSGAVSAQLTVLGLPASPCWVSVRDSPERLF